MEAAGSYSGLRRGKWGNRGEQGAIGGAYGGYKGLYKGKWGNWGL